MPHKVNVVGNVRIHDGEQDGKGGFLFMSATLAPPNISTNNLVHDPTTGQVHYQTGVGTTGGEDEDWDIYPNNNNTPNSIKQTDNRSVLIYRNSLTSSFSINAEYSFLVSDGTDGSDPDTVGFGGGTKHVVAQAREGYLHIGPGKTFNDAGSPQAGGTVTANSIMAIGEDPRFRNNSDAIQSTDIQTTGTTRIKMYSSNTQFAGGATVQNIRIYSASTADGTKQYDIDENKSYVIIAPSRELGEVGTNVDGGQMTSWVDGVDIGSKDLGLNIFARKSAFNPELPITFSKSEEINICTSVTMSHFKQFASENPLTYLNDWPLAMDQEEYKCHLTMSGHLYASTSLDTYGQFNNVVCYDKDTGRFYYTGSYGGSGIGGNSGTWNSIYSEPFDFVQGVAHNAANSQVVIGDTSFNSSGHHVNSFVTQSQLYVIEKTNIYNNAVATFANKHSRSRIVLQSFGDQQDAAQTVNPIHPNHNIYKNRTGSFILENDVISIGGSDVLSKNNFNIVTKTTDTLTQGFVGLGTTAPTELLTVGGNISSSGNIRLPNNPNGTNTLDSQAGNYSSNRGSIIFGNTDSTGTSKNSTAIYAWDATNTAQDLFVRGRENLTLAAWNGDIKFATDNNTGEFQSELKTGMKFTNEHSLIVRPVNPSYTTLYGQIGGTAIQNADEVAFESNGISSFQGDVYLGNGVNGIKYKVGGVYFTGNVANTSDIKLKENIEDLEPQLNIINKLRPRKFEWIEGWKDTKKHGKDIGLIAQEVKEVIPEIVGTCDENKETLTVDYKLLTPVLIKAIQEQQELIEKLSARIDELEKN
tara:strand:- start:832 stop:3261 length:2430 start_codon:yes stop_codon:yes gene_type:complete